MATVKVKFRKSLVSGKPGSIFYQLCHEGQVKQFSSHIHLCAEHWDADKERIVGSSSDSIVNSLLCGYRFKVDSDLSRLKHIINMLNQPGRKYTLSDVITQYRKSETSGVATFFRMQIAHCKANKKLGTARNYERTMNSFMHFLTGNEIPFTMMTETLVSDYERWLIGKGVARNSSSFYIRNLRAIYNKAVKCNLTEQCFPFRNTYTGVDKTRKRAVNEDVIMHLLTLELKPDNQLALTRDLFVFSYCARGMSFVDIAFLKKNDVCNGAICYIRRKTGQKLIVRIEPCIERIIRHYEKQTIGSPYVFPIITTTKHDTAYKQYQTGLTNYNRRLKQLGRLIDENTPLSSYTARHTWATAARNHHIPLAIISEGMGHTSEKTTQIYLASLENSVIDEANKEILGTLNKVVSL